MPPYQERVVTEKVDLDIKLTKLESFFQTETYATLEVLERVRLKAQAYHMRQYSNVLGERIAAFPPEPVPPEECGKQIEGSDYPCIEPKGHAGKCSWIPF